MRTKKDKKMIVGYVRSSTEDDKSIRKQGEQINEYCRKNGYKLSKIFTDKESGFILNRPEIQKLYEEMAKGNISMVISTDSSRLSKNTNDYLLLKTSFIKFGVRVVLISNESTNCNSYINFIEEMVTKINFLQQRIDECKGKQKRLGK